LYCSLGACSPFSLEPVTSLPFQSYLGRRTKPTPPYFATQLLSVLVIVEHFMTASESDSGGTARIKYGIALRRARDAKGLSQDALARRIGVSESLVGLIERAHRRPGASFTERAEHVLGLDGELSRLRAQASNETAPKWFGTWAKVEKAAHTIRTWQPLLVPGLLQTEGYAASVLAGKPGSTSDQVAESVRQRLQRQVLFRRSRAPMYQVLLDEGVLTRPVGGTTVMREQLEHLLLMLAHPNVTIQIVPISEAPTTGLLGAFAIAQVEGQSDWAYLESAGHGITTDRLETVRDISVRWDAIRAWANPWHLSEQRIREVMATYG
jgi:transcriptional regulator with XRE-family HTH domain